MAAQTFKVEFMVMTNEVTVDDVSVSVRIGRKRKTIPLPDLRYVYVKPHTGGDFHELMLVYETRGRRKVVRVMGGSAGPLNAAADAIVALRPDTDARHLPQDEAHRLFGVSNVERRALFLVPVIILAVFAVGMSPFLRHGLDHGQTAASIDELKKGYHPPSRNLLVSDGVLAWDYALEETYESSVSYYVPLVPPDWSLGDPVNAVLKLESDALDDLESDPPERIPVVLRNIWWEGLDGSNRRFFRKDVGLTLGKRVLLVEYMPKRAPDLAVYLLALGICLAILIPVTIVLEVRRRRTAAAQARTA